MTLVIGLVEALQVQIAKQQKIWIPNWANGSLLVTCTVDQAKEELLSAMAEMSFSVIVCHLTIGTSRW